MKRYCQTLSLKNDPQLIEAYVREHAHVWPEVQAGIKEVGILDMQIYIHENQLFMIVDTVDDFDWERDMNRLATLPRQAEWEAYMDRFQDAGEGKKSNEKWQLMTRIFKLG
ncbi:MAG: L-rhamnose mutarotase [Bacteroidales bacterium]|jgi:L-rhamnose mutarotase|nr:L-rhamnose mutarotase [Bacteroidales bacterium]